MQHVRTRRRHAAAVAALCLIAQVVGLAHLLVVQHVECAAHGEMVHVARWQSQPAAAARSTDPRAALLVGDDRRNATVDSHEHCAWLSQVRDVPAYRAPIVVAVAVTPWSTVATLVERAARPARPLYRLAPKVSPPFLA